MYQLHGDFHTQDPLVANQYMVFSDWDRWCSVVADEWDKKVAIIGDHRVERRKETIVIDGESFNPQLVVPKSNGLELHTDDNILYFTFIGTVDDNMEPSEGITYTSFSIVSPTPGEEEAIELAFDDLSDLSTDIPIPEFRINLTNKPDSVSGGCGEFKPPNACWVVIPECASRGYSDYRWRVNRTPHGVIIHEIGHYIHQILVEYNHTTNQEIRQIFPPEDDITNYSDKNYRENFAESWRLFVTNKDLLEIIAEEKVEFFEKFFDVPSRDLESCYEDYTGLIQSQLESASTNEHIRSSLGFF